MEAHCTTNFYFKETQNPFIYKSTHIRARRPGVPKSVHAYVHTQQREGHCGFPAARCLHAVDAASAGLRSMAPNRGGHGALCGSGLLRFKAPIYTLDSSGEE